MFQIIELITSIDYRLMNIISPVLKSENLSTSEFIVLWKVNKKVYRITDLAKSAGVMPSTMTAMFDRLSLRGLVERVHDPNDRRSVMICGTTELKELTERISRGVNDLWDKSSGMIPDDFLASFIQDLKTMRNYLEPFKDGNKND